LGAGDAEGSKSGAGYMTVTNKGSMPDRLSCVSSDASAECQLHSMTMEKGVMKMRAVEGGLEIRAGEAVKLKPSSTHLMFLNLKHPLEQGSTVAATLLFEKAGTVQVEFPIAAIGAIPQCPFAGVCVEPHLRSTNSSQAQYPKLSSVAMFTGYQANQRCHSD
jgi:copper(I)-binding protein